MSSDTAGSHEAMLRLAEADAARLRALAYRMLGSWSEAEDMVQEALTRLWQLDEGHVVEPRAFLTRVVTNLCLDQLRSARARRETYVGTWLPEPVLDTESLRGDAATEVAEDVSMALLCVFERLSSLERAAFLLHDVFDLDFAEVARVLSRSEAACRQLARRARVRVREERARFVVDVERQREFAAGFFRAVREADVESLQRWLAPDAQWLTDAGGRPAARNPILGPDRIARLVTGVQQHWPPRAWLGETSLNGVPALIGRDVEGVLFALLVQCGPEGVRRVYNIRNPDKLEALSAIYGPCVPQGTGCLSDGVARPFTSGS